jgi:hypothetical protein
VGAPLLQARSSNASKMVPITDTSSEPAQPRREEKNANIGNQLGNGEMLLVAAEVIAPLASACYTEPHPKASETTMPGQRLAEAPHL